MSELRDECYKCLNNQKCLGGAEYGSLYCMMNRRLKMQNEEDSVYTYKFATMQKQIDDKDKRIKELEEENKKILNSKIGIDLSYDDYIPIQKVKAKIEELNDGIKRDMINYDKVQEESWKKAIHHSMHQKIETKKVLEELLEEK